MRLRPFAGAEDVAGLASAAAAEGFRFVAALVAEWESGENRFDRPGERLLVAEAEGTVVGVGGLNADPYRPDGLTGRVRRLYVSPGARRHGVGTALVRQIVEAAEGTFKTLRLRTYNADAAAFYEALGFERVEGDEFCSHERLLGAGE